MKRILDYEVSRGENCILAVIRDYINYFIPHNTSEEKLFIAADSLDFRYDTKLWRILSPQPLVALNNKLNAGMGWVQGESIEAIMMNIRIKLDKGIPSVVPVSTEFLEYSDIFTKYKGRPHLLAVYGIDDSIGKAYVGDSRIIKSKKGCYKGELSLVNLEKAIESASNRYLKIEDLNTMKHLNYKEEFTRMLKAYINSSSYGKGINAAYDFAKGLDKLKIIDPQELKELCLDIVYGIRVMDFMETKVLMRNSVELLFKDQNVDYFVTGLNKIITDWNSLTMLITKIGLTRDTSLIGKVQDNFNILLDTERKLILSFL